jgi:5'-nucleotidase/UDP-sugar diphosphatase
MFVCKKRSSLSILTLIVLMLSLGPTAWADGPLTVTLLHTNDTHAHLESFEPFGQPLQGGVARRYTAIQQVKAEGGNVLLLDGGDAFQGTLFFNQWQGEEEAYFMNALGYQAMAVGNHEFDSGPATLASFIQQATFPVLSANIDVSAEPALAGLVKAYDILEVGGEKIGILGLTSEDTAFISSPGSNVVFKDAIESATAAVAELEAQGINKIIAVTHLGYSRDMEVAAAIDGIDVIVGGHSHTLLGSMEGAAGAYPTVVASPAGGTVLIVQAYDWGKYLGRLDVTFTAEGKIEDYSGAPIFIDESIAEDATIVADVTQFAAPIEELRATVIGQAAVDLEGTRELVRSQETNLGNLICDAMLWKTIPENTQICLQNGGGIRASIPAGDVTMGQVLEVLPFGNQIATFGLKGSDVWAALENGVSQHEEQGGRFPQVGGLKYTFDPNQAVGSRIVSVEVKNADGSYSPIDLDAVYQVAANDFMRGGGDGYDMFANNAIDAYDSGAVLADAVAEYIGANSPVSPAVEGRIAQVEAPETLPTTGGESLPEPSASLIVLLGVTIIALGVYAQQRERGKV